MNYSIARDIHNKLKEFNVVTTVGFNNDIIFIYLKRKRNLAEEMNIKCIIEDAYPYAIVQYKIMGTEFI